MAHLSLDKYSYVKMAHSWLDKYSYVKMIPDEAADSYFARVEGTVFMIAQLHIRKEPSEINGDIIRNLSDSYDRLKRSSLLRATTREEIKVVFREGYTNLVMSGKAGVKAHAMVISTSLDGGRRYSGRRKWSRKGKGSSQQEQHSISNNQSDRGWREGGRGRVGGGGRGSGWGRGGNQDGRGCPSGSGSRERSTYAKNKRQPRGSEPAISNDNPRPRCFQYDQIGLGVGECTAAVRLDTNPNPPRGLYFI